MVRKTGRKTASIKDVAALAGVSVPTVSRYVNKTAYVSPDKEEKIANAIQLLGYSPNPIARALVNQHTRSIAVLSSNTTLYGQAQTIAGIEEAARIAGYVVSIGVLSGNTRKELQEDIHASLAQRPAGIIVLNYDKTGNDALALLDGSLPIVAIAGERNPEYAQVSLEERRGGYEATRYLLSLGHKTVVHVAIPGEPSEDTRLEGWRQACEEAGVTMTAPINTSWDPEEACKIGYQLPSSTTAVFAGNDEIAMGIIRGLKNSGRNVPDDVSVAGFDDNPLGRIWDPSLTTIRQDFYKAGQAAVELIQEQIRQHAEQGNTKSSMEATSSARTSTDSQPAYRQITGQLVIRESTGPAAN